jgi:CubicO group peptidase (beta-lactamase class C family)
MRAGLGRVFPAAVLHVRQAGATVFERAYGCLDPDVRRRPTRPDSLFDLASLTKLFTATAFMTLVEAGHVALRTPVAEVLPEFAGTRPIGPAEDPLSKATIAPDPQFAGQEVDASTVTFWHLLTHTSGLAAWHSLYRERGEQEAGGAGPPAAVPLPHQVPPPLRARRIAAIYERYGFAYPPGARVVYSDLGFILLGEAIARLTGDPLETFVRRAVLDPLGLRATTYNPLANGFPRKRIVPTELCAWRRRRCVGEVHDENSAGLGGVAGHAGLFSTAAGVATLGQMALDGGVYDRIRLLRPETVAEMVRVQAGGDENPRGLGWLQRSPGYSSSGRMFGPRSFGHTGFTGTSLWVDPDRELAIALLTNRVYCGRDAEPIADFRPRLHDAVVEALSAARAATHPQSAP